MHDYNKNERDYNENGHAYNENELGLVHSLQNNPVKNVASWIGLVVIGSCVITNRLTMIPCRSLSLCQLPPGSWRVTMRNAYNCHSFNYRALEVNFEFVVHLLSPRVGSKFQFNKNNIMILICIIQTGVNFN